MIAPECNIRGAERFESINKIVNLQSLSLTEYKSHFNAYIMYTMYMIAIL